MIVRSDGEGLVIESQEKTVYIHFYKPLSTQCSYRRASFWHADIFVGVPHGKVVMTSRKKIEPKTKVEVGIDLHTDETLKLTIESYDKYSLLINYGMSDTFKVSTHEFFELNAGEGLNSCYQRLCYFFTDIPEEAKSIPDVN